MARTRRSFTEEFKREVVRLAEQRVNTVAKVALDLGIDASVLRRWIVQMRSGTWESTAGKPLKSAQQQEIDQLRRELAKVKTERDILKKAVGYFAKDPASALCQAVCSSPKPT